jgi:hypothetical protein
MSINFKDLVLPACVAVFVGSVLSADRMPEVYEEHKNLIFAAGVTAAGVIASTAAKWTWRQIRPYVVTGGVVNAAHAEALRILNDVNLLSQPNIDRLIANAQHAQHLVQGFEALNDAGLLTQSNIDRLVVNRQYAWHLGQAFESLNRAGLLTQPNIDTLFANAQYAWNLRQGFEVLNRGGLLIQPNVVALIANAQHAENLFQGFETLENTALLTQVNIDALIEDPHYALILARGFKTLNDADLLTEDNRDNLAMGFEFLNEGGLLTQPNIEALIANAPHALGLAHGFEVLKSNGRLMQPNIDALIRNAQRAEDLADGFEILGAAGLLTQPNIDALIANAQYALVLVQGFELLNNVGLLTQPNIYTLFVTAQHAEEAARQQLQGFIINIEDIAEQTRATLLQYAEIVQENRGALPRIEYQHNPVVDAGGVTRDFISKLFKSIFTNPERFPVVNAENGLLLKITQQENIEPVKAIGTVFAAGLLNKSFTTGKYLDPMMFDMILSLEKEDIERIPENLEGLPKNILDKLAARYIASQYPNGLGGVSNDQFLHEYPEATQVVHAAAVLAKSMYSHLGEQGWAREVTGKTANDLTGAIQGDISREIIIAAIRRSDANQVAVNLLEGWLNQANENQLKQFLIAVTGSATLLPNQTLTVNQTTLQALRGGTFAFHTCFNSVDVAVDQIRGEFNNSLSEAIRDIRFNIE